jgi:hypothetical protein
VRDVACSLLNTHYGGSFMRALPHIYPEFDWHMWKFTQVPRRFWADPKNQREFMDWVFKDLDLQDMSDWYKVSVTDVRQRGGWALLCMHFKGSLSRAIMSIYPGK